MTSVPIQDYRKALNLVDDQQLLIREWKDLVNDLLGLAARWETHASGLETLLCGLEPLDPDAEDCKSQREDLVGERQALGIVAADLIRQIKLARESS